MSTPVPELPASQQVTVRTMEVTIRIALILGLAVWCFRIVEPFLSTVIWAIITAIALFPIFNWAQTRVPQRRKLVATVFTAIMLLSTIESAFNAIWRVEKSRPFGMRLLAYWTTLTLGPLLMGAGLSFSTAVFAANNFQTLGFDLSIIRETGLRLLPFIFATAGSFQLATRRL